MKDQGILVRTTSDKQLQVVSRIFQGQITEFEA